MINLYGRIYKKNNKYTMYYSNSSINFKFCNNLELIFTTKKYELDECITILINKYIKREYIINKELVLTFNESNEP